jgi:predicted ATPase
MRRPSGLLTEENFALLERGAELPGVYDAILNRDRDAWDAIEASVRQGFPSIRRLALKAVSSQQKVLEVELVDGTRVSADQLSEGLLYWLAFAALPYVSPTQLLLIEEPENGLHPARIAEVIRVLREVVSRGTQVVMATHSPLVVNELKPEEVSVVTRTPRRGRAYAA